MQLYVMIPSPRISCQKYARTSSAVDGQRNWLQSACCVAQMIDPLLGQIYLYKPALKVESPQQEGPPVLVVMILALRRSTRITVGSTMPCFTVTTRVIFSSVSCFV